MMCSKPPFDTNSQVSLQPVNLGDGPSLGGALRSILSLLTPPSFEPAEPSEASVLFGEPGWRWGTPARADVYLPEGDGPHPSVLLVHGGGFLVGSRRMKPARFLATKLRAAGYAVCVPSYRQVFRGGGLTQAAQDISQAMSWWVGRTEELGLAPERRAMICLSAGSPIALTATEALPDDAFHHVVSIFGMTDFRTARGLLSALIPPCVLRTWNEGEIARRSPVERRRLPIPLTLMHGTRDALVPYQQALDLVARREAAGLDTRLVSYEGAPHSFFNEASDPLCQEALEDLLSSLGEAPDASELREGSSRA